MPLADQSHDALSSAMIEAALAGGRDVMAVYGTDFGVQRKADGSPVSDADRRAEAAIVGRLEAAFPDVPIVAEEAFAAERTPAPGGRFFLVDPLDGTKEFLARNGEFTVNIALIDAGIPVAGVVLAPALLDIYVGVLGSGARRARLDSLDRGPTTWVRIRTRPSPTSPVAVVSRSHLTPETERQLGRAGAVERRSIGSSLKFCILAEGAADFYPRLGPTMEWDTAAGDAVLRAAGGAVATLDGAPLLYGKTGRASLRDLENPHFLAAGDPALLIALAERRQSYNISAHERAQAEVRFDRHRGVCEGRDQD